SFERVTGNANEKILAWGLGVRKPLCFRQRETVFGEMHAAGALRERHVQPIIHQDACCSRVTCLPFCGPPQSFARKQSAVSSRKIFLANLNPIDASSSGGSDLH